MTSTNDFLTNQVARRLGSIAEDLEALAAYVRREAESLDTFNDGESRKGGFVAVAATVQSRVMNALPNLGLDALTRAAADADLYREPARQ